MLSLQPLDSRSSLGFVGSFDMSWANDLSLAELSAPTSQAPPPLRAPSAGGAASPIFKPRRSKAATYAGLLGASRAAAQRSPPPPRPPQPAAKAGQEYARALEAWVQGLAGQAPLDISATL